MASEKTIKTIKDYKSSPSRVIQSLGLTNHRLKTKNDDRRTTIKNQQIKIRDLSASRERWKKKAGELSQQVQALNDQLVEQKKTK